VISGYRVQQGRYEMIGKGNPQWPQVYECVKLARVASFNVGQPGHSRLGTRFTLNVMLVQSGLNISESVILTNSNNDTDLAGTNFFQRY